MNQSTSVARASQFGETLMENVLRFPVSGVAVSEFCSERDSSSVDQLVGEGSTSREDGKTDTQRDPLSGVLEGMEQLYSEPVFLLVSFYQDGATRIQRVLRRKSAARHASYRAINPGERPQAVTPQVKDRLARFLQHADPSIDRPTVSRLKEELRKVMSELEDARRSLEEQRLEFEELLAGIPPAQRTLSQDDDTDFSLKTAVKGLVCGFAKVDEATLEIGSETDTNVSTTTARKLKTRTPESSLAAYSRLVGIEPTRFYELVVERLDVEVDLVEYKAREALLRFYKPPEWGKALHPLQDVVASAKAAQKELNMVIDSAIQRGVEPPDG